MKASSPMARRLAIFMILITCATIRAAAQIIPSDDLLAPFRPLGKADWEPALLPPLDRPGAAPVNELQRHWLEKGFHFERRAIPDALIEQYKTDWIRDNEEKAQRTGGFPHPTPYMHVRSMRDILCQVRSGDVGEWQDFGFSNWVETVRNPHHFRSARPTPRPTCTSSCTTSRGTRWGCISR